MNILGPSYIEGLYALSVDESKAIELLQLQQAGELGSAAGHHNRGTTYKKGKETEIDKKKTVHHWKIEAMMGHVAAHNLKLVEFQNGNNQRAMKHFIISAKVEDKDYLHYVKEGFRVGYMTRTSVARLPGIV